jgi:general secretion pathway protein M
MIERWHALASRERRFVVIGGIAALAVLVLAVLVPLNGSVERAEARIDGKAQDLAWMQSVAPELAGAGPVNTPTTGESLVVVIDRAARESGLSTSLVSSEPSGPNALRVRFEKAPFDRLVGLLGRLAEQHGAHAEAATVDSGEAPGIVNASFVLRTR